MRISSCEPPARPLAPTVDPVRSAHGDDSRSRLCSAHVDGHVRSLPRGDKLVASIAMQNLTSGPGWGAFAESAVPDQGDSLTREEWLEKWLSEAPVLTEERADEILELMELK
ncbi:hypothetical protein OG585_10755 [Streptomyces sp. NBC_01340]|uniref:hypothetical protein n=2 Tax=Streptomyces TaxID=1883 RepID=UPI002253F00A|nr:MULTISPECIES: hypothetical protein [unclassified Streptomyces]MCX4453200.1 hypothetical protein [Streptomyces sp. NBC_01719]MCX4492560.1 hypothetical protein [Streptomyces sp. NBC_01728]WSI37718.1 hypothetical protein OG585_10755 [Streptomyces sp. NBC_01340]